MRDYDIYVVKEIGSDEQTYGVIRGGDLIPYTFDHITDLYGRGLGAYISVPITDEKPRLLLPREYIK